MNDFPGLGFMLKKSIYEKYLKGKWNTCCMNRAWDNWLLNINEQNNVFYTLIPDVSRSYRRAYNSINADFAYIDNLFNRQRQTNLLPFAEIDNIEYLSDKSKYEKHLKDKLLQSIDFPNITKCYTDGRIDYPSQYKK